MKSDSAFENKEHRGKFSKNWNRAYVHILDNFKVRISFFTLSSLVASPIRPNCNF